jgi:hypothetical protein
MSLLTLVAEAAAINAPVFVAIARAITNLLFIVALSRTTRHRVSNRQAKFIASRCKQSNGRKNRILAIARKKAHKGNCRSQGLTLNFAYWENRGDNNAMRAFFDSGFFDTLSKTCIGCGAGL